MQSFLSHASQDSTFVRQVADRLDRYYCDGPCRFSEDSLSDGCLPPASSKAIEDSSGMVVFVGQHVPAHQIAEVSLALSLQKQVVVVLLPSPKQHALPTKQSNFPPELQMLERCHHISVKSNRNTTRKADSLATPRPGEQLQGPPDPMPGENLRVARKAAGYLGVRKAFLCHAGDDSEFVIEVAKHLKRNLNDVFYYEEYQRSEEPFLKTLGTALEECNVMVVFPGPQLGNYQKKEVSAAVELDSDFVVVCLPERELPTEWRMLGGYEPERVSAWKDAVTLRHEARRVAEAIGKRLEVRPWLSEDGLPANLHMFDYEKRVIDYFVEKASLEHDIARARKTLDIGEAGRDGPQDPKRFFEELHRKYDQGDRDGQGSKSPDSWADVLLWLQKRYEKDIREKQLEGCPAKWPEVVHWADRSTDNRISPDVIGDFRDDRAQVVAVALSRYLRDETSSESVLPFLGFPEAGPRAKLAYPEPGRNLNVAILVSGGIAPGINAVIDGITQRHELYANPNYHNYHVQVFGLKNGFLAFENLMGSYSTLSTKEEAMGANLCTSSHASEGGAILGTSRFEDLVNAETTIGKLESIVEQLFHAEIDILYVIGGDGSMRAAHAVWNVAQEYAAKRKLKHGLSVIGIPKTMDNDILWVWQTFGFPSAVERAREVIDNLAVEVKSNPRLGVVQLFGSDSGFVVSHAVLASRTGVCDAALIPEADFSMECLAYYLKEKMCKRRQEEHALIPYGFVVMAETAIPLDAMHFVDNPNVGLSEPEKQAVRDFDLLRKIGGRMRGQTRDELRTAGLKIVSRGLDMLLRDKDIDVQYPVQPNWERLRIFTNEPRHLLRAIPPRTIDIITAQRLGMLAVDNALAGHTDFMISQWLTEYVLVPLELVILGRKRIPQGGIFWKSVVDKTGQPFDLVNPHRRPASEIAQNQDDRFLVKLKQWFLDHPDATPEDIRSAMQSLAVSLTASMPEAKSCQETS